MNSGEECDGRAANRAHWAARGAAWRRTAPESRATTDEQNRALIEAAGVTPGATVLDIASGTGEPAISLARRVGPGGVVWSTDLVPEMLEGARRRAADAGATNIRFAIADMECLPFADAAFDAVTCRFGLMFPTNPVTAAAEARRVLRPGCKVAYMVWGPMEANTAFHVVRRTVLEFFGEDPDAGPVTRHRLAAAGSVAEILEAAGFVEIAEHEVIETSEVPADRPFWSTRLERNFSDRLARLDAAGRARLEEALVRAFAPYRDGDVYRLGTHARLCVGAAPG